MGIWTKKSITDLQNALKNEDHHPALNRTLGPANLIMLGLGAIIGAGLFSITGIAAAQNAGPAIVIAFLIASIGCAFSGLCYSEMSSMIPVAGSAYTYAYATMGELLAWIIGWDLILEYAIGSATVSISLSAYVVSLLHDFHIYPPTALLASPWQSVLLPDGSRVFGIINLPALAIVMAVSIVLMIGIKESAFFNAIVVIIKVSIVVVFIGIGFFYINPSNYVPFIPPNTGTFGEFGWSGIFRAAGVVFFAYIGFDALSTAAQETKNPKKNVPIAIFGSLVICTILYILFAFVMTGLVNYKNLDVAAPVAVAIGNTPHHWLQILIKFAIIAGFTSVILVMLLGQSRIFYSMARDGLLPKIFSDIHPRFQTPWRSNLILMIFVGAFGAFAPLHLVGHMTSIGTLFAFVIVCAGVLVLRYTQPDLPRPFKAPWVPLTPLLGILVCVTMMASLGKDNWIRLISWLLIGMLIYAFYGRKHAQRQKPL
jgi:basic amino acid/polyamine antiporter, APA family